MPPFDQIRALLAAWRKYRWKRIVGPIVEQIDAVDAELEIARRHHQGVRPLLRRKRALKTKQIKLELSL